MKKLLFFLFAFLLFNVFYSYSADHFQEKGAAEGKNGQQLIDAVIKQDVSEVQRLLKSDVDINYQDKDGQTALMTAIPYKEGFEIVKLLVDNGANTNLKNKYGKTSLILASFFENPRIVELLLEKNPIIDDKNAALRHTFQNGNTEIAKLLLDAGANPNALDEVDRTALMDLVSDSKYNNSVEMVKLLLENGADPKIKNKAGETALSLSINEDISDILKKEMAYEINDRESKIN